MSALSLLHVIESYLANNPYLTEGGLPGATDAQVYQQLSDANVHPDLKTHPNTHYWYLFLSNFLPHIRDQWIQKANSNKPKAPQEKKDKKKDDKKKEEKEVKKEEKKEEKKDDFDDMFGDDAPTETKKEQPKSKPAVVVKKEKPKAIAKSILVFDVKVYDTETDLDELAKRILALEIDGLVWNKQPKKIEVAFGIYKLQIGCVIEDAKVLTDDIYDKIEAWEEVQSTDSVSMQKL